MIDKSLRQYYENGKEVDPYRKGLEIIAGKGKDTIQTTAPGKITARNLIKPAEKMTLPSVRKDKTVPSITTLPKTARPSFDQKKYSGLASAFYDKIKAGEESYLDKYINRDPVRTAGGVEEWGEDYDYLTSSAAPDTALAAAPDTALTAAPDKPLAQLVTYPQTDTAITSTGEGETATSYTDTQMQNIIENANPDEKNFITTIFKTANDTIDNLGIDKTKIATNLVKNKVGKIVATELGISGGAAGGPIGMLIGWLVGKAIEKFTGGKEKKEEIEGIFSFDDEIITPIAPIYSNPNEDRAREEAAAKAASDAMVAKEIAAAEAFRADKEKQEELARQAKAYAEAQAAKAPPQITQPTGGGNGGGQPQTGGGGYERGDYGGRGYHWAKGGRVDKALGGRIRDI